MKKTLPVLILVAVVVVAVLFLIQKRSPGGAARVPAILPKDTLALLYLPDVPRTRAAWEKTALHRIGQEPEVAQFLASLTGEIPKYSETKAKLAEIAKAEPKELFVAVTDDKPTVILGFQYSGKREDVDALVEQARERIQKLAPTGQADIQMHGNVQIETFRFGETQLAAAYYEDWFLAANDLELLEKSIDRLRAGDGSETLDESDLFKTSLASMPKAFDALFFAQTETLIERLVALLGVSGQKLDERQVAELRKVKAVAGSMKFEGANVRDTMFVLKPGAEAAPELARSSLAFTAADTALYYVSKFEVPDKLELPEASLDVTGMLAMAKGFAAALESQGVTLAAVGKAFGPEIGAVLDWTPDSMQPSFTLVLDVREYVEALKLLDAVSAAGLGGTPVARQEVEGGVYYSMASTGLPWLPPPGIALSEKYAVVGLSIDSIMAGLNQAASGKGGLADSKAFAEAASSVVAPTRSFGYVDTKALFDRLYGTVRAFLVTYAMFAPQSSPYFDPAKLPPGEAISKHLGPMVYSQAEVKDGVLAESVGPVTFSQSLVAAALGGGAAVLPIVKKQLEEGGLFPGAGALPGAQTPVAPEPDVPEATPTPEPTELPLEATPAPAE